MAENEAENLVLDASVIIKWILKENDYVIARKIAARYINKEVNISIPSFSYAEISNVLGRKYDGEALSFISHLKFGSIEEKIMSLKVFSMTFDLMKKYPRVSFYDAAYHALALSENATFVTADADYYKIAKKEGQIIMLKDYA